jgi:hypothetical protein
LESCAKTSNNDPFFVEKNVVQIVEREKATQIPTQVQREQCKKVAREVCQEGGTKCDTFYELKCEIDFETIYETIVEIVHDEKVTSISEKISKLSVSVGFIVPKGFGGVGIPFKACYAKFAKLGAPECEDGKLYLFGGSKDVTSHSPVNSENYNIRTSLLFTREITSLTKDDETFRWESLELLGYKNSLPIDAPLFVVVQITNGDKDYTFAQLQQDVKKQGYGNLLDDYNDVKDYGYSFQLSTFLNK